MLDLIAEGDIILAGGHLPAAELHVVFAEAKQRGVKKMLVNHPTYIVGCSDEDIRQLVALGVYMEHSICMFVEGKAHKYGPDKLAHLIEVAGVDHTVLCSDLGLQGSPRPIEGFGRSCGYCSTCRCRAPRSGSSSATKCGGLPEPAGDPIGGARRGLARQAQRPRKAARAIWGGGR